MSLILNQVASDEIIALAYFSIPLWLFFSVRARRLAVRANGQTWMLVLFALFIFSCGFGHEIDAWYEWHGICAAFSPAKVICNWSTAVLSAITAVIIVPRSLVYVAAITAPVDVARLQARIAELEKRVSGSS